MRDKFNTYLFNYNFDGDRWSFEIKARSPEEAKRRVARMVYAQYDGQLKLSIPADRHALRAVIRRWFGLEYAA